MVNFLNEITQPGDVDFQLQLNHQTTLICQRVVRVLPQKRLVCQAIWQGKSVFAKLFLGTDAVKYISRDVAGIKLLTDANIDTPPLLYQGETADKNAQVLLLAAIKPADTAEVIWLNSGQEARFTLAKRLTVEVAKHHNANLLQTDLYLKNFLVTDNKIYTLDGDGIRQCSHLSDQQALQNLSVLWSKFDVLEVEKWQRDLAAVYASSRVAEIQLEPAKLASMANQHRLKLASHYADKKVFRQCSDVNVTASQGLFIAASSHAKISVPQNVAELDALIQPKNLLKNGNTCTVALAEIDDRKVVIKRYNIKSFWHGVSRAFRPSRAAASWANAHRLNILGITTAKPIALYEQRNFGLRGKAYFLAEYVDAPDVAQFFAQTQNKDQRDEAVNNIATLFYRLYLLQISHGDMKASNIKMQGAQPVLIDLDSMRQHRQANIAAHVRDLQRFMQNWRAINQPDDNALYNAFVQAFKTAYPDDALLTKAGIATKKE